MDFGLTGEALGVWRGVVLATAAFLILWAFWPDILKGFRWKRKASASAADPAPLLPSITINGPAVSIKTIINHAGPDGRIKSRPPFGSVIARHEEKNTTFGTVYGPFRVSIAGPEAVQTQAEIIGWLSHHRLLAALDDEDQAYHPKPAPDIEGIQS